jgi:predicted AAA+ superfamily ATPase
MGKFIINQILSSKKSLIDIGFFRIRQGAEVDVVISKGTKGLACAEIKYSNQLHISKGNMQAFKDLKAPDNFVVTPSSDKFYHKKDFMMIPLKNFIIEILPNIS